ncbi:Protein kinase-like domain [Pseudocohnilembus persalinus]|uniref:Protein kinase-like domain n=1 Tax=Pseudocohnilembus persalinus TaxID=266149 RepID=A0A0V0R4S6_PSEPJ|nr:Protein kinase-like domain [Pseudocohnilembus persalinus]|eukprot:KRX09483.1 Protein kinase-like domain [Pseudocohnilembus persalinus]
MAQAVSHIHKQGFVHRDIKLENILIDDDYKLVLSDFGLSTRVSKGELLTQYIGTSSYMAPEIVAKQDYYGESCDIFALGVILFCLLYQNYPFQGKAQPSDPHYKYFANKNHIRYWLLVEKQTKKFYSPELKSLINGMLAYDVNERITMEEILEHEWLNTDVPSQEEVKQIIQEYYQEQEQKMEEDDLISNSSSTHLDNKLQGNYGQEGVKQKC